MQNMHQILNLFKEDLKKYKKGGKSNQPPANVLTCQTCLWIIGKGITHKCENNAKKMEQTIMEITSATVKDKTDKKGKATLATAVKHIIVTFKNSIFNYYNIQQQLHLSSMISIQSTLELSNTKILKL